MDALVSHRRDAAAALVALLLAGCGAAGDRAPTVALSDCRLPRLSMAAKCAVVRVPEDRAKLDFTIALTVQTMNYLHSGRHRIVR